MNPYLLGFSWRLRRSSPFILENRMPSSWGASGLRRIEGHLWQEGKPTKNPWPPHGSLPNPLCSRSLSIMPAVIAKFSGDAFTEAVKKAVLNRRMKSSTPPQNSGPLIHLFTPFVLKFTTIKKKKTHLLYSFLFPLFSSLFLLFCFVFALFLFRLFWAKQKTASFLG